MKINFFLNNKAAIMKIANSIFKTFFLSLCIIANASVSYAQTASILPPAKTQILDDNGNPLVSGKVDYYIPGTTTRKTTWQDAGKTIPNTNPVTLDGAGRATMLGDGSYRQVVKDRLGNLIWDAVTSSTGSGGGGGGSATVGDGQPVGSVQVWAGFIAPYGYVFAYGQEVTRVGFPELFAAITINQNVTCSTGSPILTSIGDTSQLPVGAKIESVCLNAGATIVSKTSSTVTASANAIISSTATARFFPYGNGDGSLTYTVPDYRGRVPAARDNMGGIAANRLTASGLGVAADAIGAVGGSQTRTIAQAQLPNVGLNFSGASGSVVSNSTTTFLATNGTPQAIVAGAGGGNYIALNTGSSNSASIVTSTGSFSNVSGTTASINGGVTQTGSPTVQPSITANYVIKIIPDSNPNSFFGVASIGGMTGIITCGLGVTCAGNNISVAGVAAGVSTLNTLTGGLNLVAGTNITSIVPSGSSITINAASSASACDTLENHSGGIGASAAVNVAAWNAVMAAMPATGGCLALGSGSYNLTGVVTTTLPASQYNVTVYGTGQNSTKLNWVTTGGLTFVYNGAANSIAMRDFTMLSNVTNTGTGINLVQNVGGGGPSFTNFDRLSIEYFNTAIYTGGVNAINVRDSSIYGTTSTSAGIWCQGSNASTYTVAVNIDGTNFWNLGNGVIWGSYCQSMFVSHFNVIGGVNGFIVLSGAAGALTNLIINSGGISGHSGTGIAMSTAVVDVQIFGLFIASNPGQFAMDLTGASFGTITNNSIACTPSTGSNGIALRAPSLSMMVTGNTFRDCATGIGITAGATSNNIQSNLYSSVTTNTVNAGGASNKIGGGSD